jgi:hypothetical protein
MKSLGKGPVTEAKVNEVRAAFVRSPENQQDKQPDN